MDIKNSIFSKSFLYTNIVVAFAFLLIVLRLWYLQVMEGEYFRYRSENNRIRTRYLPAPRGFIYDRFGKVIVSNKPSYNIEYIPEDAKDFDKTLDKISAILSISKEDLKAELSKYQIKRKPFEPKLFLKNVKKETLAKVIANLHALPGITYSVIPQRNYLYGDFASHILGYVREISSEQLGKKEYKRYQAGDIVGKSGIEYSFESLLRGKRGVQGIIVNAKGSRISESYFEPPQSGHNLYLTIDYYLQELAEGLMEKKRGVLFLMSAKTGEIYTMVSKPAFDPNIFTKEIPMPIWKEIIKKPQNRLTNRATMALYPPGSVFKPIVALAGINEKEIDSKEKIKCQGEFLLGKNSKFRCHNRGGHGNLGLAKALEKSCNVYFYDLGVRLGIDRIHYYSDFFGFGKLTGINGLLENKGVVPSRAWKKATFTKKSDQRWYPGETPSVSVGQGALRVTPIQVAKAYAALANGGFLITPSIVKKIKAEEGQYEESLLALDKTKLPFDKKIYDQIKKGLVKVVATGTGVKAKLNTSLKYQVAGKTGTAQLRSFSTEENLPKSETLAWFAGYAPIKKPEIVIVALVESGGHGGETAAPLAKKLLEAYFSSNQRLESNLPVNRL